MILHTVSPRLMQQYTKNLLRDSKFKVSQPSTSSSKDPFFKVNIIKNRKGQHIEYSGGRSESDIVNWILKRTGPPSVEVKTCEELKTKVDNAKMALVFFGDSSAKEFSSVFIPLAENPTAGDKYQFFHISSSDCASEHGVTSTPALVFFRKFDESPVVYPGSIEVDSILLWL